MATGTIISAEKQVVFGERLWWLLGGGLPLRESRIPESAKRQVNKRCGGRCESCGEPMVTVENIGSGCNRPLHLRAVCAACSRTKPYTDTAYPLSEGVAKTLATLASRAISPKPLRVCDDPDSWDWRAHLAQRRLALSVNPCPGQGQPPEVP
ncbi:MAG: hypothetical protein KF857_08375 [Fimbriimonadaceae bacterium]|nr:hypothetical protein [Fimbriimonadaceae bacterium]